MTPTRWRISCSMRGGLAIASSATLVRQRRSDTKEQGINGPAFFFPPDDVEGSDASGAKERH